MDSVVVVISSNDIYPRRHRGDHLAPRHHTAERPLYGGEKSRLMFRWFH